MESKIFHFAFCEFVQQTVNYLPIASSSLKSYASCIKKIKNKKNKVWLMETGVFKKSRMARQGKSHYLSSFASHNGDLFFVFRGAFSFQHPGIS